MKKRNLFVTIFVFAFVSSAFAAAPGSLDASFGAAGVVKTNILQIDTLYDIETQSDGKIVAVGTSNAQTRFTVVRYLADGSLDTTFNSIGSILLGFGTSTARATDVKIQPDGKIIVAGFIDDATINDSAGIARFNPNGSQDFTFSGDGITTLGNFIVNGMELQSDGKILLGGRTEAGLSDAKVVRLNPDGSLDTTFDTDGIVTTNIDGADTLADIKIMTDGRIVGAGNSGGTEYSVVVRYLSNGALDGQFSGDGIAFNDFRNGPEPVEDLVVELFSGLITTVGEHGGNEMTLVSYLLNGNLNSAFSGDGILSINNPINRASAIVQQSDRKFVCLGYFNAAVNQTDVQLVRVNLNGTIDTGFGTNGFINLNDNSGNGDLKRMALSGDKLVVGNGANNEGDFGIERFNLSAVPTQSGDFDGDGFSDYAVFRPSNTTWFVLRSLDNTVQFTGFGANGDIPMDGDFDGDGKNDFAIYRPSVGQWWINRSSLGTTVAFQFGLSTDRAAPGDYDKDGKTDVGLFRPSTGEWLILRSSSNNTTFYGFQFGQNSDIPITRQGF